MHEIDSQGHPEDQRLAAYLDRTLPPVERAEVEGHLSWCVDCRTVVRETARELAVRRRRRYAVAGIGTLAAAAVIAVLWIGPAVDIEDSTPRTRMPPTIDGAESLIRVLDVQERASLSDAPPSFTWSSVGSGIRYRFSLSRPDGTEVWSGSVVDTVVTLPEGVEIVPGQTYIWFVDALLPDGRSATTGLQRISFEP